MNMTSRFTLLAGVAGLILAGCSSSEEGDIEDPPPLPPPGFTQGGLGGTGQTGVAGTGGAPAVPTGGSGGAPAAAGAGGAPASAGGTGGVAGTGGTGGGAIPTGTGNLLMHDATGWVAGTTNGVGVQGSFHTISDADGTPPGDTTLTLGDMAASPTRACVSGTASQVQTPAGGMADYTRYWGGGLGLNLADPGGGVGPMPWTRGTVTGFSFTVTGTTIPAALRFQATTPAGGTTYCLNDTAPGANTVTFGSLVSECYNMTPGPALPTTTALQSLQWQVVTNTTATVPFDFCIENLTAITTP
jgi:hypothetical protein